MRTIEILNKRIALCPNLRAHSYYAITLFDALNSIRTGKYKTQIEKIRRLYNLGEPAILGYKSRKKQLSSFLFTGTLYDSRFKFDISGYTSLMIVDIDKLDSVADTKEILKKDPHVISVWISPTGNGLKALFYIEYDKTFSDADIWIFHENCAFPQLKKYLATSYGIKIDTTGGVITRLCFVSYDPDIHMKSEFDPFMVSCNLSNTQIKKIRRRYYTSRNSVRKALREQLRIAKWLKQGAKMQNIVNTE